MQKVFFSTSGIIPICNTLKATVVNRNSLCMFDSSFEVHSYGTAKFKNQKFLSYMQECMKKWKKLVLIRNSIFVNNFRKQ